MYLGKMSRCFFYKFPIARILLYYYRTISRNIMNFKNFFDGTFSGLNAYPFIDKKTRVFFTIIMIKILCNYKQMLICDMIDRNIIQLQVILRHCIHPLAVTIQRCTGKAVDIHFTYPYLQQMINSQKKTSIYKNSLILSFPTMYRSNKVF